MTEYRRPAKGGRIIHIVVAGKAICGATTKMWAPEKLAGATCGLCLSKRATQRKHDKLALRREPRP